MSSSFGQKSPLQPLVALVLATVVGSIDVSIAHADDQGEALRNYCRSEHCAKDFVRAATLYCLKQDQSKRCTAQAEQEYTKCGYTGNFVALEESARREMLFVLLIAGAAQPTTKRTHRPEGLMMAEVE